jgi:phosphatidylglycerol---prolipoprotein diacylglyceryl transferase
VTPGDYRRLAYGGFMLLGMAVFLLARRVLPRPAGLSAVPGWKRAGLLLAAFIGGSLGGKLPFTVSAFLSWLSGSPQWDAGAVAVELISVWFSDGKTIVCGLIGAYLAVELAKRLLDVRVKTGDSFAVPMALAMAVGRWGCFVNGCCYGVETTLPWGVWFEVRGSDGTMQWMKCHPTQIYESMFHFTMAVIVIWLTVRDLLPRQRLKLYLIAYGVYRFLTEYIRPEPRYWPGLTFYQWAALGLIGGLLVQWWIDSAQRPDRNPLLAPRAGPKMGCMAGLSKARIAADE